MVSGIMEENEDWGRVQVDLWRLMLAAHWEWKIDWERGIKE